MSGLGTADQGNAARLDAGVGSWSPRARLEWLATHKLAHLGLARLHRFSGRRHDAVRARRPGSTSDAVTARAGPLRGRGPCLEELARRVAATGKAKSGPGKGCRQGSGLGREHAGIDDPLLGPVRASKVNADAVLRQARHAAGLPQCEVATGPGCS